MTAVFLLGFMAAFATMSVVSFCTVVTLAVAALVERRRSRRTRITLPVAYQLGPRRRLVLDRMRTRQRIPTVLDATWREVPR